MAKVIEQTLPAEQVVTGASLAGKIAAVVGASLFMAACAHVAIPLPWTPVPITLQTFGVLLIGLILGSRMGFAALALYLLEGAAGLPVFSPAGPGGVAQLIGPTGGFLMAYPFAAYVAGFARENIKQAWTANVAAWLCASGLVFIFGASWFALLTKQTFFTTLNMAVFPFLPGDVLKSFAAIAIAEGWRRYKRS